MRASWDHYFMDIAVAVATRATCSRKHVGAVIVRDKTILSTGYNGSIRGMDHCDDAGHLMEDGHCVRTIHAEANAILQAAKNGTAIDGATLYSTASPCWPCFGLVANSGIKRIVFGEAYRAGDPGPKRVIEVAKLAGIELVALAQKAVLPEFSQCTQCGRTVPNLKVKLSGCESCGCQVFRCVSSMPVDEERLAEATARRLAHNLDPETRHAQPMCPEVHPDNKLPCKLPDGHDGAHSNAIQNVICTYCEWTGPAPDPVACPKCKNKVLIPVHSEFVDRATQKFGTSDEPLPVAKKTKEDFFY